MESTNSNITEYNVNSNENNKTQNEIDLDKEQLKKLSLNLGNVMLVFNQVFSQIKNANNSDLVMVLGNTGDGKTTLLSSIIFGA